MTKKEAAQTATPANRDKTGRFVKNRSGNPSGRPTLPKEFKELAQTKSLDALRRLVGIMEDAQARDDHVIRACELIIAYGYGKPQQSVALSGEVYNPYANLTTEELKKLIGDE